MNVKQSTIDSFFKKKEEVKIYKDHDKPIIDSNINQTPKKNVPFRIKNPK